MEKAIQEVLKKYPKDKPYIVGVSGGCDSMCLLDLLVKNHYQVIVCHVNYNLRNDTIEDYLVVSEYCKKNHIPFYYKEVDYIPKDNFQDAARKIRYQFYYEIGQLYHTHDVFLGHHQDDVLETIMMQKERNQQYTYWGIKENSIVQQNHVIRILLACLKKEIIEYCQKYHVPYHDDYTNFQTHFRRDYLRNVCIPQMSETQKQEILNEAKYHNQAINNQNQKIEKIFKKVYQHHRLIYPLIAKEDLEDTIRYYLIESIPTKKVSQSLVKEVVKSLNSSSPNIIVKLPCNKQFVKEYDKAYIETQTSLHSYQYQFDTLDKYKHSYFLIQKSGHPNCGVYVDEHSWPITIRNIKPGDTIELSYGTKKVQRLFIDQKIPKKYRNIWPIVVDKNGKILLIPNIAKNIAQINTKPNVFVVELISNKLEDY